MRAAQPVKGAREQGQRPASLLAGQHHNASDDYQSAGS
jgi:hypothetical protein